MKRYLTTLAVSLCCWTLGASDSAEPPHLIQAELIAHQIDQSQNEYAHKDCFIKWKGENGAESYQNRTDCSDFLDLLLEHTYHFTSAQMKGWTGHDRPLAMGWYETIQAKNGFDVIATVKSIEPGDVLAIKFPPGAADTGHIMIAASVPAHRSATAPLQPGTEQWELDVIDSSKSGHGKEDTRRRPDGTFAHGVGKGTIRLYSRTDGTIAGYTWSIASVSTFAVASDHKIVVGRLQHRL